MNDDDDDGDDDNTSNDDTLPPATRDSAKSKRTLSPRDKDTSICPCCERILIVQQHMTYLN